MPGLVHKPNRIVVAVDESYQHATASAALHWAAKNLCSPGNEFHLVTVLPPPSLAIYPVAPIATASAVAAVAHTWEAQRAHDEQHAACCLKAAAQMMVESGVPKEALHAHALPAAGGASGVAESIVEFTKTARMDMVVMGSRGMGSVRRSLLSLVGLGSVSDYCIHNLHTPVIVVRLDAHVEETSTKAPRTVCVAFDDSAQSAYALTWTLQHLLREGDVLHIITVAVPVAFPVLDETSPAVAALEYQQWQTTTEGSLQYAQQLATKAGEAAVQRGWSAEALVTGSLAPEGGASGVAESIANYAKKEQVDLLVVGARGLGSFKRSMMSFVGLGSVSDYLVHNVTSCPVAVIKVQDPAQLQPAAGAAGAAAEHPAQAPAAAPAEGSGMADMAAAAEVDTGQVHPAASAAGASSSAGDGNRQEGAPD